jgi:hypothetical protein
MERCDLKNPKNNKIIILILSGKDNKDRRDAQRQTWLKNTNIPYKFVLGNEADILEAQEPDILWTDSPDDNLPRKLISAYQRVSDRYDFDYIFTCDDDTYVVVERLLDCGFENHMYMGTRWKNHAEGGAGFFLSRETIERFTQVPLDHLILTGPSDVAIGNLAKMYTVNLHEDNRFVQGHSSIKRHGELPMPFNDKITSHYLGPELMHKVHTQFTRLYWKRMLAQDPKFQQAYNILFQANA